MASTSELFLLVKSMKQSEKRYFKIFASQFRDKDDSIYIRLFDAIDGMETYDEKKLKQQFKGEPFVNHLFVTKNHLSKIIVKSLSSYHSKASVHSRLVESLQAIEILFEKGLYQQCLKYISQGKKLAAEYQKSLQLLQFIDWECKVEIRRSHHSSVVKKIEEGMEVLKNHEQMLQYKRRAFRMCERNISQGFVRNEEQIKELKKIISELPSGETNDLLNTLGKYYDFTTNNMFYGLIGDVKNRYIYAEKTVKLLEENPNIIQEHPGFYIIAVNNLCNALMQFGKIDETIDYVRKMRVLPEKYKISLWSDARMRAIVFSYDIEIFAYTVSGQVEKAIDMEQELKLMLKENRSQISRDDLMSLQFNMCHALFIGQKFEQALEWANDILNDFDPNYRADLYYACRVFVLMIHFELKNYILLENLLNTTEKFLRKKNRLFEIESGLIHFFKVVIRNPDKLETALLSLQKTTEQYKDDPFHGTILFYIEIRAWIQNKLEKKDYNQLVMEKFYREVNLPLPDIKSKKKSTYKQKVA